jgi:hypothetical protein
MSKKINRKTITRGLSVFLVVILLVGTNTMAGASSLNEVLRKQCEELAGGYLTSDGYTNPEFMAFSKMWAKYYLDMLPTSSEPELLKKLTVHPERNDISGWANFFYAGEPNYMVSETYRIVDSLGISSNNSPAENAEKISWYINNTYDGIRSFGQAIERTPAVYADELKYGKYDCTTLSMGYEAVFRIAGVPAVSVDMLSYGSPHEECFYYLNGEWYHMMGDDFLKYFNNVAYRTVLSPTLNHEHPYFPTEREQVNSDGVQDLPSWVNRDSARFIESWLRKPLAYPNKPLTRGEVANLVCHYLGVVPMRNEQLYTDVALTDVNSPYIWAVNKLGIMGGIGNGKFSPNRELTMQEYAIVAMRVIDYGLSKQAAEAQKQLQAIENNPTGWPPTSSSTQVIINSLKEKVNWQAYLDEIATDPIVFVDNNKIADWAKSDIDRLSSLRLLQGDSTGSDSKLRPTDALSKTRFLVFMANMNYHLNLYRGDYTGDPLF